MFVNKATENVNKHRDDGKKYILMIDESLKNSAYNIIDIVRSYCAHGSMIRNIVEYVSDIMLHLKREIKPKE